MAAVVRLLRCSTPPGWIDAVLSDLDAFLIDHAACERKASATGMAFVVRYPDRRELLDPLIAFAREELEHFHRVYRVLDARGLSLGADRKDPYVRRLRQLARQPSEQHLMDRLLVAAVVEARGCERFGLLAKALPDGELKQLYVDLERAEARHHGLFLQLALRLFDEDEVRARLEQISQFEATLIEQLPLRPALH